MGWLRWIARRLKRSVRGDDGADEIEAELRHHIEREVEAFLERGMSRREAWRAARRAFGPAHAERVRRARTFPALADLRTDLVHAARAYLRDPVFALAVAGSLALAVGAGTAFFSVARAVYLVPLPYPEADRIVVLANHYPAQDVRWAAQTAGDLADYRDESTRFSALGGLSASPFTITAEDGTPRRVPGATVTPGFFEVLGVRPALGVPLDSTRQAGDEVLISHGLWRDRYGAVPSIAGATLAGSTERIVGVLPESFRVHASAEDGVLEQDFEVFRLAPSGWYGADGRNRSAAWMRVYARLAPGATLESARAEMDAIAASQRARLADRAERGAIIGVEPLRDAMTAGVGDVMTAVGLAVAVLLLIACANAAGLLLARGEARRSELSLRIALGAGRGRLVRQLTAESLLLGVLGAGFAVLLARAGVGALAARLPLDLPLASELSLDAPVLVFALLLGLACTLAFGVGPAALSVGVRPGRALGGRGRGSTPSRALLRAWLVGGQIALSSGLLVGAGLLARSSARLAEIDPGLEVVDRAAFTVVPPSAAWQAQGFEAMADQLDAVFEPVLDRVRGIPGVEGAAVVWPSPFSGRAGQRPFRLEDQDPEAAQGQMAYVRAVTPGYFDLMGIPLLQGRDLTSTDRGEALVVSRGLVEGYIPDGRAIGRRIEVDAFGGAVTGTVVGVVADHRAYRLRSDEDATVYRWAPRFLAGPPDVVVHTSLEQSEWVPAVRRAVAEAAPGTLVDGLTMLDDRARSQTADTRFFRTLLLAIGGVALALAWVGLYGLLSFLVGQRRPEIGVRMALGARARAVVGLVARRGLISALPGIVVGLMLARWGARFLASLLFGVEVGDPLSYLAIGAGLLAVSLLACVIPARRATRIDPVAILRE